MNYIEVCFEIEPFQPFSEILTADLADIGFESFVEDQKQLKAYITEADFSEVNLKKITETLKAEAVIEYKINLIQDQNWNAEWEKNFPAVEVGKYCRIRAPFHSSDESFEHELVIEPKMSFGTGHHATTFLMVESMQNYDLKHKYVLDMGCGTGVLAILAEKEGAADVVAIDIEEWAFENTKENIERNNCTKIKALKGGAELLQPDQFDVVFANINRNILLRDFAAYEKSMKANSKIFLSGFFESDVEELKKKAAILNLEFVEQKKREDWSLLIFGKK